MFGYDYSFCSNTNCSRKDCRRHQSNSPVGVPYSIAGLWNGDPAECTWYYPGVSGNRLDLNEATEEELMSLDCLGPTKVRSILAYRERHGKFDCMADLRKCRGIGGKTYDELRKVAFVKVNLSSVYGEMR